MTESANRRTLAPMKVTPTTGAVALLLAAGGFYLWRKLSMSLARLNASIDSLTAAVDRVAERLANSDTVPAADVDNAASRVEDLVTRLDSILAGTGNETLAPQERRHK